MRNNNVSPTEYKINIATTIFPLYDIAKNIAGEEVAVTNILPAGASPHTFEMTPEKVRELQNVQILFKIGHEIDDWTSSLAESYDGIEVVIVDNDISLLPFSEFHIHDEEDEHELEEENAEMDPHYWLSVNNAKSIASTIANKLSSIDPENADNYTNNLNSYLQKLTDLIDDAKSKLADLGSNELIVTHDAWQYFNADFGLETVGAFQPSPGQEPTPQELAELQKSVSDNGVKALFTEPQLSKDIIEPFASDVNLPVYILDPMGGIDNRQSYIDLIKYNVDTIYQALK
jgi:zinc transport system substrate-binding protein